MKKIAILSIVLGEVHIQMLSNFVYILILSALFRGYIDFLNRSNLNIRAHFRTYYYKIGLNNVVQHIVANII